MSYKLKLNCFFIGLTIVLFVFSPKNANGQQVLSVLQSETQDLGTMEKVYKVECDFILQNQAQKNIYLLKAESVPEIKVWASKKSIKTSDTSLLTVSFIPSKKGYFNYEIKLIVTESFEPITLRVTGKIASLAPDDKTACYYFGSSQARVNRNNKIYLPKKNPFLYYENYSSDENTDEPEIIEFRSDSIPDIQIKNLNKIKTKFPSELYKRNNLIFLIDISGSMADTTKLRWLKLSLKNLIEDIRPSDRISILSYSDSVRLLVKGLNYYKKDTP